MQANATLPMVAIPLGEQLADADARTTRPALAGMAALIPASVEQLAEQARQHPEPSTCPAWSGICTVTEADHHDHFNHDHQVVNKSGGQLLDVGFAALSNDSNPAPVIYIGSEDYAPGEFHGASATVRRLMDTGDAMAETTMLRQGNGETALARIDQKIGDEQTRLVGLVAYRRQVADQLRPARTPLDEPADEQTSHAAFSLAHDAIALALAKSPDRAATLRALRSMVALYADEATA